MKEKTLKARTIRQEGRIKGKKKKDGLIPFWSLSIISLDFLDLYFYLLSIPQLLSDLEAGLKHSNEYLIKVYHRGH